ncbi:uncharacterized protein A1O5_06929 [Cladophialophora psammophila CBS 110553]|uniref:Uncharacterized protein n=1 Tax=Cladophialophora psammophila CBS 110553 TaxID=1182543 RepID=W9WNW6_9EURO|nr:uncharacterized protein A1O5_06929 [Cladophialophora psammophila CBS 110553]EXJ69857.1 hypothetical protein A1O5_06929 [Cladophialophora psammophila CBS 110553]
MAAKNGPSDIFELSTPSLHSSGDPLWTGASPDRPETVIPRRQEPGKVLDIGRYGFGVLSLGTLLIAGAIAFLWFLWKADDHNNFWRRIVAEGRIAQAIALTALVIRFAVFAQAALCTSMLANLALQRSHVTLPNSVSMALLQYQNNGPHQLVVDLFDSCKRRKAVIVGLLAVFLLLTTTVVQFTSTILLSDLQISPIAGLVQNTSIPSTLNWDAGISSQATWSGEGYMLLPPAQYPAFAEYSEVGEVREAIDGVHDTGTVMRAFMPILQKSSRETLQSYDGKATVLDSRVVCGRPVVKHASLDMGNIDECAGPRISGDISIDLSSVPRFRYHENDKGAKNFSCSTAVPNAQRRSEWSLMACPVTQTAGIVSAMDSIDEVLDPNSGTRYGMNTYMLYGVGQAYLLINTTGTWGRWLNYCKRQKIFEDDDGGPTVSNLRLASEADYVSRGEWLDIPTNDPLVTFSLSLCYSAFNVADRHISASSWRNRTEPSIEWDYDNRTFSTEGIRLQMGTVGLNNTGPSSKINDTLAERGILSLAPPEPDSSSSSVRRDVWVSSANMRLESRTGQAILLNSNLGWKHTALTFCLDCQPTFGNSSSNPATGRDTSSGRSSLHPHYLSLVSTTLDATGHPALALQSVFTNLFSMAYYDLALKFDSREEIHLSSFVVALRPVTWKAFASVMVLLIVHLALVDCVIILFASQGQGVIGGGWASVSQLRSDSLSAWIDSQVGENRDRRVGEEMKRLGDARKWVGFGANGRIEVQTETSSSYVRT